MDKRVIYTGIIILIFFTVATLTCKKSETTDTTDSQEPTTTDVEQLSVIPDDIDDETKYELIDIARVSILSKWSPGEVIIPDDNPFNNLERGLFVTLTKDGELRGCMGSIYPYDDVISEVVDLSRTAAFEDPRFPPLQQEEFNEIDIEISLLSPLITMKNEYDFLLGENGVVIEYKGKTGVLLPQVVEGDETWTKDDFLSIVSQKAGLGANGWKKFPVTMRKFRCVIIQ